MVKAVGWLARILGFRRRRTPAHLVVSRLEPVAPRVAGSDAASPRAGAGASGNPSSAFTPTRPKPGRRQLVGREAELTRIVQAIVDERAHVVLYSERGRGKTSLANLAAEALRRQERVVARYTCEASSTFDTVVRGLARDLPASMLATHGDHGDGCEGALPPGPLKPRDVADFPSRIDCRELVCVVDEFDRIEDAQTRTLFADTIKQISDRGIGLSFVIVGVSENLEQILGQHPSIQRNIAAIHLPLLTDAEIAAMLDKGGRDSGLAFPSAVVARVTQVARGMPYMAQLLGLRIAQAALARGSAAASGADVDEAIDRLVGDARQQVAAQYARLTDGGRDLAATQALRRIAMAEQDRLGRLEVVERADGGALVGGQEIAAPQWARLREERVLKPSDDTPGLVTYADRALIYHVLLLAVRALAPEGSSSGSASVTSLAADPRARRPLAATNR